MNKYKDYRVEVIRYDKDKSTTTNFYTLKELKEIKRDITVNLPSIKKTVVKINKDIIYDTVKQFTFNTKDKDYKTRLKFYNEVEHYINENFVRKVATYNEDCILANIYDKVFNNTQFEEFYNSMVQDIDYQFIDSSKNIICFELSGKYYKLELKEISEKEFKED